MNNSNSINIEQNKPERLILLRAQRIFYTRAKLWKNLFAILTIMLPVLGALFGEKYPDISPFLGVGAIVVWLIDVTIVSRKQRDYCKLAALVQEQFDTEVLQLGWNPLVAGRKVNVEEILAVASTAIPVKENKRLLDWYEPTVSRLPLSLARLVCQRTNIVYDMRVRKIYSGLMLSAAIILTICLICFGLYHKFTLDNQILTLLLPALPFVAFVLRERREQCDTIETLAMLKAEVEKLWANALAGSSSEELTTNSRALQDAIFRHRASPALIFDWLYNLLRSREEGLACYAAVTLVTEAENKMNLWEVR